MGLFLLGVVVGIVLITLGNTIGKAAIRRFEEYYHMRRTNYFLNHQIDYYKPIEKGSYPKEEDV